MLTVKNYVRAKSLEEAYDLCQKKANVVLGGMLWLKMQKRTVNTAIDLCELGLDKIEETEEGFTIGAMVSLRSLELHEGLNRLTDGAFSAAVKAIVGVQFRNCATVGGSLFGRFGFSDVLTLFQVLDAKVRLFKRGEMSISDFALLPRTERDILVSVTVPKKEMKVRYLSQRNSSTDFPVLTCALSVIGGKYTCAVGARPSFALPFYDGEGVLKDGINEKSAEAFGKAVSEKANFGSNMRGSEKYRKQLCEVLVKRAVLSLKED